MCGVDRTRGETGFCRTGYYPVVSGYGPHFGEEPPLVGLHGPGTTFISNCNLACGFCQNFHISQYGAGREISCEEFAGMMINLQHRGCHNINIVSPSHVVPQLIRAVLIAAGLGLTIPVVYNSGGYDAVETLRLLDGIVDIYMPDAKYGSNTRAGELSHAPRYVEVMQAALKEMHRQARGSRDRGRHRSPGHDHPASRAAGKSCRERYRAAMDRPGTLTGFVCQHHGPVPPGLACSGKKFRIAPGSPQAGNGRRIPVCDHLCQKKRAAPGILSGYGCRIPRSTSNWRYASSDNGQWIRSSSSFPDR